MDEETALDIYHDRVTKVEAQVAVITLRQSQMEEVLTKQVTLTEKIAAQTAASETAAAAYRERTEQHSKTIERLQEDNTDVGKILAAMRTQLDIVKYTGGLVLSLILAYLFTHFLK